MMNIDIMVDLHSVGPRKHQWVEAGHFMRYYCTRVVIEEESQTTTCRDILNYDGESGELYFSV